MDETVDTSRITIPYGMAELIIDSVNVTAVSGGRKCTDNRSVDTAVTDLSSPDEGILIDMSVATEDTPPLVTSNLVNCAGRTDTSPAVYSETVFTATDNSDTCADDRAYTSAGGEMCSTTCLATNSKQDQINERYFRLFEVLVLSVALLVVITLFSIPTILFELPENEV